MGGLVHLLDYFSVEERLGKDWQRGHATGGKRYTETSIDTFDSPEECRKAVEKHYDDLKGKPNGVIYGGHDNGGRTLDSKPCLEGDVQYLFRLIDIKAKMGLHSLTISTILMELPLGQRTFRLNEFTIYEV